VFGQKGTFAGTPVIGRGAQLSLFLVHFPEKFKLRRANLSGVRRAPMRRSDSEMQRNAEMGHFAEPSSLA
jgi:hypothetical protein